MVQHALEASRSMATSCNKSIFFMLIQMKPLMSVANSCDTLLCVMIKCCIHIYIVCICICNTYVHTYGILYNVCYYSSLLLFEVIVPSSVRMRSACVDIET